MTILNNQNDTKHFISFKVEFEITAYCTQANNNNIMLPGARVKV